MARGQSDEPGTAGSTIRSGATGTGPPGAWLALGAGMVASAALALYFGREISFTKDEYSWLSLSSQFGPGEALSPYVGHLIAIPKSIYWIVLETFGAGHYSVFQILTLASLFLMVGLLFTWLRRRVGDWAALAPCLILLVFPVDHLHYLTGNGVAIALALAFGIAALLCWERGDPLGDLAAFVLVSLGMLTYTVAVPFAFGLVVAALFERRVPLRIWVGGVPILLYGIWRLLEGSSGLASETGSIVWSNLLLLPAWAFQSLGAILAAMTGLGFDFTNAGGGPALEQGLVIGPALAVLALLGLAWRLRSGRLPLGFWVTLSILVALLASQALVWGTLDARNPGAPRYLLPGAVMLVLIAGEALRGIGIGRAAIGAIWTVTVASLMISIGILATNIGWFGTTDFAARAEVTAVGILDTSSTEPLPAARQPRVTIRSEFDAGKAGRYGYFGLTFAEIREKPIWVGNRIDRFLAESLGIGLERPTAVDRPSRCRPARLARGAKPGRIEIPSPGAIFRSSAPVFLMLGRYGDKPSIPLGLVTPGEPRVLSLPNDRGIPGDPRTVEWFVEVGEGPKGGITDLVVCGIERPGPGGTR